jgi:FkbM family methyltransferase
VYHKKIALQTCLVQKNDVNYNLDVLCEELHNNYTGKNNNIAIELFNKYYYSYYQTALGIINYHNDSIILIVKKIVKNIFFKRKQLYQRHLWLLHNIQIDSHRFVVQRALRLICAKNFNGDTNAYTPPPPQPTKYLQLFVFIKHVYRKIKNIVKHTIKKNRTEFKCIYKWCGTDYGGFYICQDMLISSYKRNNEIIVYSAGIGECVSFDLSIMEMFKNVKVFAFDPTPKSIVWIKKQDLPDNFKFYPYGISSHSGNEKMYLPKNSDHVSGSVYECNHVSKNNSITVQMKSLNDIFIENNHKYIDILKMDIEGSEFPVIESIDFENIVIGQIVIEFHERYMKQGGKLLKKAIVRLRKNGYFCFAISKNGDEYSFINKKNYCKGS